MVVDQQSSRDAIRMSPNPTRDWEPLEHTLYVRYDDQFVFHFEPFFEDLPYEVSSNRDKGACFVTDILVSLGDGLPDAVLEPR